MKLSAFCSKRANQYRVIKGRFRCNRLVTSLCLLEPTHLTPNLMTNSFNFPNSVSQSLGQGKAKNLTIATRKEEHIL